MTHEELLDFLKRREELKAKYIATGDDAVLMELINLDRRKGMRNENDKLVSDINTALGK